MMRKVQVTDPGDSEFLPGAVIDKFRFRRENERLRKDKKKPANGQTLLLGITKASLSSESFISAASFQETTKVLTEAALAGRRDYLIGLKENVILGHMVPTGTGFRDHYRTRVKKNIEFGELSSNMGITPTGLDAEMEALLSGGLGVGRGDGRQLAATGSDGLEALTRGGGTILTEDQVQPEEDAATAKTGDADLEDE
jgi:DNA-directed RNA polymerase subunit beta'